MATTVSGDAPVLLSDAEYMAMAAVMEDHHAWRNGKLGDREWDRLKVQHLAAMQAIDSRLAGFPRTVVVGRVTRTVDRPLIHTPYFSKSGTVLKVPSRGILEAKGSNPKMRNVRGQNVRRFGIHFPLVRAFGPKHTAILGGAFTRNVKGSNQPGPLRLRRTGGSREKRGLEDTTFGQYRAASGTLISVTANTKSRIQQMAAIGGVPALEGTFTVNGDRRITRDSFSCRAKLTLDPDERVQLRTVHRADGTSYPVRFIGKVGGASSGVTVSQRDAGVYQAAVARGRNLVGVERGGTILANRVPEEVQRQRAEARRERQRRQVQQRAGVGATGSLAAGSGVRRSAAQAELDLESMV